jgi:hypothetical protein
MATARRCDRGLTLAKGKGTKAIGEGATRGSGMKGGPYSSEINS